MRLDPVHPFRGSWPGSGHAWLFARKRLASSFSLSAFMFCYNMLGMLCSETFSLAVAVSARPYAVRSMHTGNCEHDLFACSRDGLLAPPCPQ